MGPEARRTPHPSALLAALDDQQRRELLRQGRYERHEAGSTLFWEATASTTVVLLQEGRVKVTHVTQDGREALLAIRGPGDVLGELGALDGAPRSATVTAVDDVEALVLPAPALRALVERDGRLALRILRVVNDRLRDADRKRAEFGALDTPTRLALRLLELSRRYGQPVNDGTDLALPLTQDELAGWVGSSREAITKALRTFRDEGWVETGRRRITILDENALRQYAHHRDPGK